MSVANACSLPGPRLDGAPIPGFFRAAPMMRSHVSAFLSALLPSQEKARTEMEKLNALKKNF
jgi:hypothetical protein